ncbi:MAG: hypothetical protein JJU45_06450 [Acidimicrobiia bacterium]|nr:hypothetical protein [Acidimicrobiia bacterium]
MGDDHLLGTGTRVLDASPVRGTLRVLATPEDVVGLMDSGADGVIALVRDAGATFLAPIFHELAGVICTNGTPESHIGIVSREYAIPCVMSCAFPHGEPAEGATVELDCAVSPAEVRVVDG